jgi:hypothetical protein
MNPQKLIRRDVWRIVVPQNVIQTRGNKLILDGEQATWIFRMAFAGIV